MMIGGSLRVYKIRASLLNWWRQLGAETVDEAYGTSKNAVKNLVAGSNNVFTITGGTSYTFDIDVVDDTLDWDKVSATVKVNW